MLKARSISDFFSVQKKPPDLGGGARSYRTNCDFIFAAKIYTQLCPSITPRWPRSLQMDVGGWSDFWYFLRRDKKSVGRVVVEGRSIWLQVLGETVAGW